MPQAGVRIESIDAGEVQAVDIRLPFEAYEIGRTEAGEPIPFSILHVMVDSNQEIAETDESNNGAVIPSEEVLPVDPALFAVDRTDSPMGSIVDVAGEGLGPEAGQVLVQIGGLQFQGEIEGWCDLGVRVKLPSLPLAESATAELVVVRGDGAASNPLELNLAPVQLAKMDSPLRRTP
jgi:hypothetical protein